MFVQWVVGGEDTLSIYASIYNVYIVLPQVKINCATINPDAHAMKALVFCHRRCLVLSGEFSPAFMLRVADLCARRVVAQCMCVWVCVCKHK